MRRFVAAAVLLLALGIGIYGAVFYEGFYLRLGERPPLDVPFRAEGTELQYWDGEAYVPLVLRGVEVSASVPGYGAAALAAEEGDFLRWFEAIGEMGANAVRAAGVMDEGFYNALYTYNTSHSQPLFLLQGCGGSIRGSGQLEALVEEGRAMVDVVHGRRDRFTGNSGGSGVYRRDVSPWTAGFLVGTEWDPDDVSYMDHSAVRPGGSQGACFRAEEGASPFETAMAGVMDAVASYETEKYGAQRPLGFLCAPDCDFLEYGEPYARQLQKHARADPEHVAAQPPMKAGRFAAYRLYEFCGDYARCLSEGQRRELAPLLEGLSKDRPYGGYLELLAGHHTMPVVAAGYSASSARGASVLGEAPLTEAEQGRRLAKASRALEDARWAGGFISTWQDEWERRSWNTAFAADPAENGLWHDLQTQAQCQGLLAFAPEAACVLDGDPSEWGEEDALLERDGLRLSARYGEEGLYLLLEGAGDSARLPLDISPELGSRTWDQNALRFQREADFLLCLDGTEDTRLLVRERWDPLRERFLYELRGEDPFASFPEGDAFVPVGMAVQDPRPEDPPGQGARRRLGVWETGKLVHGNGTPEADFCFGEGCVEFRLPWLLLNVGAPASMGVHRDYYQHWGVEFQKVRELWIGAARTGEDGEIPMGHLPVKGWKLPEYRERLKESYYVVQACWRGGEQDEGAH